MVELERAVAHSVPTPLALVLNFPSNPTAQVVGLDFYRNVVEFCRKHGIYILSDLAYAEIYFEDEPPPSILQGPGARDIAVEFTSLSKTYSMPGWRIGFAVGNASILRTLEKVKSYIDFGLFRSVQEAAITVLTGPQDCVKKTVEIYKRRRDLFVGGLNRIGWKVDYPKATFYVWAHIPSKYSALSSMEFAELLIQEAGVAVAPGTGFGEYGEGFIRFALVQEEKRLREAVKRIKPLLEIQS